MRVSRVVSVAAIMNFDDTSARSAHFHPARSRSPAKLLEKYVAHLQHKSEGQQGLSARRGRRHGGETAGEIQQHNPTREHKDGTRPSDADSHSAPDADARGIELDNRKKQMWMERVALRQLNQPLQATCTTVTATAKDKDIVNAERDDTAQGGESDVVKVATKRPSAASRGFRWANRASLWSIDETWMSLDPAGIEREAPWPVLFFGARAVERYARMCEIRSEETIIGGGQFTGHHQALQPASKPLSKPASTNSSHDMVSKLPFMDLWLQVRQSRETRCVQCDENEVHLDAAEVYRSIHTSIRLHNLASTFSPPLSEPLSLSLVLSLAHAQACV